MEFSYSLIIRLIVEVVPNLVVKGQRFSIIDLSLKKDLFFNYLVSLYKSTKH